MELVHQLNPRSREEPLLVLLMLSIAIIRQGGMRGVQLVAVCKHTARCHKIRHVMDINENIIDLLIQSFTRRWTRVFPKMPYYIKKSAFCYLWCAFCWLLRRSLYTGAISCFFLFLVQQLVQWKMEQVWDAVSYRALRPVYEDYYLSVSLSFMCFFCGLVWNHQFNAFIKQGLIALNQTQCSLTLSSKVTKRRCGKMTRRGHEGWRGSFMASF